MREEGAGVFGSFGFGDDEWSAGREAQPAQIAQSDG